MRVLSLWSSTLELKSHTGLGSFVFSRLDIIRPRAQEVEVTRSLAGAAGVGCFSDLWDCAHKTHFFFSPRHFYGSWYTFASPKILLEYGKKCSSFLPWHFSSSLLGSCFVLESPSAPAVLFPNLRIFAIPSLGVPAAHPALLKGLSDPCHWSVSLASRVTLAGGGGQEPLSEPLPG